MLVLGIHPAWNIHPVTQVHLCRVERMYSNSACQVCKYKCVLAPPSPTYHIGECTFSSRYPPYSHLVYIPRETFIRLHVCGIRSTKWAELAQHVVTWWCNARMVRERPRFILCETFIRYVPGIHRAWNIHPVIQVRIHRVHRMYSKSACQVSK